MHLPPIPLMLIIILAFTIWLRLMIRKSDRNNRRNIEQFWEKETESNHVRKKDISNLDYIKIPMDTLPITETTDATLLSIHKTITDLSKKSILNLTGLSNTELKLRYGVANLTFLSECDANFTLLARTLYQWGSYLYQEGNIEDALKVLEFGITCKTDVGKHYHLLATIYKNMNNSNKITQLIEVAQSLSSLSKDSILKDLEAIQ
jgi:tetratricopeptide (TPR) repeat protein